MAEDNSQQNIIRSILRSEVTWVITFVGITIGFFNTVVLPLNAMRIQLSQIQSDLSKQAVNYEALSLTVQALNTTVTVLKNRIDNLK